MSGLYHQMLSALGIAVLIHTRGTRFRVDTAPHWLQALIEDIAALKAVDSPDVQGIYLELAALVRQVPGLSRELPPMATTLGELRLSERVVLMAASCQIRRIHSTRRTYTTVYPRGTFVAGRGTMR